MAAQVHLAHPAFSAWRDTQRQAFVIAQRLPALEQRSHAEMIVRQSGKAASQGAFVEQPVEGRRVGIDRQLWIRQPRDSGCLRGFVRHVGMLD
ncbi:hypothetical protein D3C73_1380730 [compost metagenome]